jgi:hypothetical protein
MSRLSSTCELIVTQLMKQVLSGIKQGIVYHEALFSHLVPLLSRSERLSLPYRVFYEDALEVEL